MKNLLKFDEFGSLTENEQAEYKKKLKAALSKVWSFAPENPTSKEKSKPWVDKLDGKLAVAPDGKSKEDSQVSDNEKQEEKE